MPRPGGKPTLNIQRLWDLTEAHIKEAIGDRTSMAKLLRELASLARPGEGAPKILIAIARIAEPGCDWLEGTLRVEIAPVQGAEKTKTLISIAEDLGGGVLELLFPRLTLDVPIAEFERSLRLAPRAVEPLAIKVAKDQPGKLFLTHKKTKSTKAQSPSFEVAEDCLRQSLPPAVRKSLVPLAPLPDLVPARSSKEPVLRRRVRSNPAAKKAIAEDAPESDRPTAARPPPLPTTAKKKPSRQPVVAGQSSDGFPTMMEIPRAPKILDFGDLLPPKKKPSRIPPARG